MPAHPHITGQETLVRELGEGQTLSLRISPCSWMYAGYGLQVSCTLTDGNSVFVRPLRDGKRIPFESATPSDLQSVLDGVRLASCSRCGRVTFDPAAYGDAENNRAGLCEACFVHDLNADLVREQAVEGIRERQWLAERHADGDRYLAEAWVHPFNGDDRQVRLCFKAKPTAAEIKRWLSRQGSEVLGDYAIRALPAPQPVPGGVAEELRAVADHFKTLDHWIEAAKMLGGRRSTRGETVSFRFPDGSRLTMNRSTLALMGLSTNA